jgi:hypothetical protein
MKRIKRRKRVALKLEIATNGLTRSPRTIGISETGDSDRDSIGLIPLTLVIDLQQECKYTPF